MAEPDPFDAVLNQLAVQRQTVDRQYTPDDPFKALNRDFADDAQAKAIGSVTADPNKAAKNLQLSTDSGFDPSVVAGDPKGVEIGQKANQASEYVGKNRYLQSYVRKHENYAEISNDDWEKLDEVSKMFAASGLIDVPGIGTVVASQKLAKQLPGGSFINGIYQGIKNLYEVKPKEAFSTTEEYIDYLRQREENEGNLAFLLAQLFVGGGAKFPAAVDVLRSTREFNNFMKDSGMNVGGARWHPEFDDFLDDPNFRPLGPQELATMRPGVRPGEVGPLNLGERDEVTGEPRPAPPPLLLAAPRPTTVTEQMVRAGQVPPTGIDPLMDKFHQALIKHDLDTFDQIIAAVQASNTYGRSQKAVSEFLQTFLKETSVGVDREAVEKLYNKQVPGPGDGLLGYVPDIVERMATSRATGVDVRIPMADYVAFTDPATHTALRDDLRLRPDGITRNEAMALGTMDPDSIPKTLEQGIRKSFYFQPMFLDQKPVGLPAGMYAKYFNKIVKEGQERLDRIWKASQRDVAREQTPEWKANRVRIKDQVTTDTRYDPGVRADRFLRMQELPNGVRVSKVKLHASTLERFVKAGQLPRSLLEKYGDANGQMPDAIANLLDFKNGAELINALARFERARGELEPRQYFDQLVKAETDKRMKAQYGDLAKNIYKETQERVLAEDQIDVFIDEMYMVAKLGGVDAPMTKADLQAFARQEFRKERGTDVAFETYRKAAEKSGRAALDKALSKKYLESFKNIQERIISTYMAKESLAFERRMNKLNNLIERYGTNNTVTGVAQEYANQIHKIFEDVGLPTIRNPMELAKALKIDGYDSLPAFVGAKKAAGYDPAVDTELIGLGDNHPYSKYTVAQLDAFRESLESLDRLGRIDNFIKSAGKTIDIQIARANVIANVEASGGKYAPRHPSKIAEKVKGIRDFDALLTKPEQVADWFDRGDPLGPFNTYVFRALSDGQHVKNALMKELGQRIRKLPGKKSIAKQLNDKIENNTLVDWQTGEMREMNVSDLLGVMFHMGNESNFKMLTKEFRVGTGPNSYTVKWDPMAVKAWVDKNATKEHWDFVQGVWDLWEDFLWPKMEEMARQVSGVPPTKVEARPIRTRFGDYRGGYSPLQADPAWIGEAPGAEEMFGMGRWFRSLPGRHWEYERTNAAYPLDLKYNAQVQRLSEAVHDLAMRQPLIQAWKILGDQQVQLAIRKNFGEETRRQMIYWLKYVSNGKLLSDDALTALNQVARWTHDKITTAQLLYRASTIIKHSLAAGINSAAEVGMARYGFNFLKLYASPEGWRMLRMMNEKFPALRDRMHDMDRDLGIMYDKAIGSNRYSDYLKFFGGWAVAKMDLLSAYPTAYTQYQRAMLAGMDEQEAIFTAEKAMRNAHGASGIVDLAPIQRGGDWQRLLTIAYSFFSHNYNRMRNIGRQATQLLLPGPMPRLSITDQRDRDRTTARVFIDFMRLAYRFAVYVPLTGMLVHWVQKGNKEDEETLESIERHMAAGTVEELLGPIPLAREAAYSVADLVDQLYGEGTVPHAFKDPMDQPVTQIIKTLFKGVSEMAKLAFGEEARRIDVKDMILAIHMLKSIPGAGQIGATAQFWTDVEMGLQKADTTGEMVRGTLFGRSNPDEPIKVPRARSGRHWGR